MKLGPVTTLDKRNKKTSKEIWCWRHVVTLWRHYYFSNLRPILSNLEAGFRTHSKTYIFISSNFSSYKNWKQNWKISNTALTLLLWVQALFWPKSTDFLQKNTDISKILGLGTKRYIFRNYIWACTYVPNFGFLVISSTSKQTPKDPTQIRVNRRSGME